MMKLATLPFVLYLTLWSSTADAELADPAGSFASATESLEAGEPDSAATSYEELIADDWHSPELYHNLGVAYQRQGHPEAALLQLYRAWLIAPFSSSAKAQFLNHAKETDISKSRLSQAEAQVAALAWRTPLALIAFVTFWIGVCLLIVTKKPIPRAFGIAGIALGLVLSAAAYYFHQEAPNAQHAWIITSEAEPIRASHGKGAPKISTAMPLTQVEIQSSRDGWKFVRNDRDTSGWVTEASVGLLMPWR